MVKTPEQMRNMVEGWIKITGNKYQDTTAKMQEKNPNIQWQFLFGQSMYITKIKSRDDRIFIHSALGFAENMTNGIQKLGEQGTIELINGINEIIALSGLTCKWIYKDKLFLGIEVKSYVDEEELNRPTVFKTIDNISTIADVIIKKIAVRINPIGVKTTDVGKASDKQMYT
ncbi:MAG: DUF2299 family protein [Thaumarchaeota archaeon]|nr:DUF2299 family protein [Nitrososphaerota archaeon]